MHFRPFFLQFLSLLFLLSGCARSEPAGETSWRREDIGKLRIQLVDPTAQESLWFSDDGTVTAEYGTRDSMVGTILYWRLSKGRLEVYNDQHVIEVLSLVSISPKDVVAKNESGQVVHYRRLPIPKRT